MRAVSDHVQPFALNLARLRHCPACGVVIDAVPPVACRACGTWHWRNAKPCAGGLVTRDGALLLIRRTIEPWRGCWDVPGGFCDPDEHPAQTVVREVREETGLEVVVGDLLGIWMDTYGGAVGDDPATSTMNVYYLATPIGNRPVALDRSEADDARWFTPGELPTEVSFPEHTGQVLAAWSARAEG